jgi:hypothetical protein
MQQHPDEGSLRDAQRRLDAFLDCIAYLLARRWLQDPRHAEEKPTQETHQAPEEPTGQLNGE